MLNPCPALTTARRLSAFAAVCLLLLAASAAAGTSWNPFAVTARAQEAQESAAAPLTLLTMSGEPGDFIGGTTSHVYRPEDGGFGAQAADRRQNGQIDYVQISFGNANHWWFLEFSTDQLNAPLRPGLYTNAQRAPFATAGHPGLNVFGDGRGCNILTGNFRVHEINVDNTVIPAKVNSFVASFEQHCEGGTPALLGTVYYNSSTTFPTRAINGRVADTNGNGAPNVQVVMSGSHAATTTTDGAGNYSFPGLLEGGHYRLTPTQPSNRIITPATSSVKNVLADATANFTSVSLVTLNGQVTNSAGAPLTGVTVSLSGSRTATATTDANGNYSFTGLRADGNYTVTPSRTFYGFSPPSQTFNTLPGDQAANFTGALRSHHIIGRVIDNLGVGIGGVTMVLGGSEARTTQTDANGNYAFTGLTAGGSYTVSPNLRHFVFGPQSQTFSGLGGDWSNINFTGTRLTHAVSGVVLDGSGNGLAGVVVHLSGSQTGVTVTNSSGNYSFTSLPAGGNYTVTPSKWENVFSPAGRTVNDLGGAQAFNFVSAVNPTHFFVRQQYLDFLGREPDADGLRFWSEGIDSCTSQQCRDVKKVDTSAAFFLSIEFQETGYLAYRMFKAAYGDATSPAVAGTVPVIRRQEFLPDAQRIGQNVQVGVGNWQQQLETNKNAYVLEFVGRQRFRNAYPQTMTPAEFVGRLAENTGAALSAEERGALVNDLAANNTDAGRAAVLRRVAEDEDLRRAEFNRAFVLMQYYGYMRRNPDDPQDTNFGGWRFWLDKLEQFDGNYVNAEMVRAFIESIEYRQRFGQ